MTTASFMLRDTGSLWHDEAPTAASLRPLESKSTPRTLPSPNPPPPTAHLQKVSVIVVNYNAGMLLLECVEAALGQAEQVIVVDNHSSDLSMQWLSERFPQHPRLVTQLVSDNLGFSVGCNQGLQHATQPHILFLNPDCILGNDSLARMVEVLQGDTTIGMVGGLLANLDGTEQGGGRRAVPTPWRSFVRAFGLHRLSNRWPRLFFDFYLHTQPLPKTPIEVEAISGALMLVSRAAVEDVGLWDESYFLHCEDLDWCMRFRQKHWKILFVPDAPVVHHLGHSSRVRPYFVEWHKHKGMIYFYRKFFQHQYPGILMWLVDAGVWLRFGMVVVRHFFSRVVGRLKAWLQGHGHGNRHGDGS